MVQHIAVRDGEDHAAPKRSVLEIADMKKKRPLQISFYNTGSGWILLRSNLPEKTIKIYLSDVFDPFEDLLSWLEDVYVGDFPTEIIIDEKGYGKKF